MHQINYYKLILACCCFLLINCKQPYQPLVSPKNASLSEASVPEHDRKLALEGVIIRIVDGDTAEMLYNNELPLMIRLEHIDAPEKRGSQAFGNKAKQVLSDLCFKQKITLLTDGDFDMGGRIIGEIIKEQNRNVNKEMVRLGYAWHFTKYSTDNSYTRLQKEAQQKKVGLWSDPHAMPPWEWRKR